VSLLHRDDGRTAADASTDVLVIDLEATTQLRDVRLELVDWLEAHGATTTEMMDLVHASTELVTNAVEHAYPAAGVRGPVRVRATVEPTGAVLVEVTDQGRWRTPVDHISRGRGLVMAAALTDDLALTTGEGGTRARVRHQVGAATSAPQRPAIPPTGSSSVAATPRPRALHLTGVLVGHDVAPLVEALDRMAPLAGSGRDDGTSGAGDQECVATVDLTGVAAVSAAVIDVFRRLADRGRTAPRLVVRRGSVPHLELERADIRCHVEHGDPPVGAGSR
jgi:anti-sigma regulatory factor (Ser/Thr protein kinase)